MTEALKVVSLQLWSASGALKMRHKENNHEAIKETWEISTHEFEATNGALFHGWFQKVCRFVLGKFPLKGHGQQGGMGSSTADSVLNCVQSLS